MNRSFFRIISWSLFFTLLWLIFIQLGYHEIKHNAIFLALASGLPNVISNIWLQVFVVSFIVIIIGNATGMEWIFFIVMCGIQAITTFLGLGIFQKALNAGNASTVIPIQQIPQQIAPIIIYYLIYDFPSPSLISLPIMIAGIVLITISGFILSKRQAMLENIK